MNTIHSLLHRFFLIGAFCICAIAVVFFMNQRTNAVLAEGVSLNAASTQPVNGVCSDINGTRVATMPKENLCKSGLPSVVVEKNIDGNSGWAWICSGINGGENNYCNVLRYVEIDNGGELAKSADSNDINTDNASGITTMPVVNTINTVNTENTTNETTNSTANQQVVTNTQPIMNVQPEIVNTTVEIIKNEAANTNNAEISQKLNDETRGNAGNSVDTSVLRVNTNINNEPVASRINNTSDAVVENLIIENQIASGSASQVENVERSVIVKPAVIIEATNLLQSNNPKTSGTTNPALKVETVEIIAQQNNGKGGLKISGKAESNALVTIYIFSRDPIVITIKADSNGNWNYELDRDLDDGQHEAFVAVTDGAGKIVSKSEPIAFVKTAQAATMIPMSALTANQSPVQRVSQQYVLMAIIIMSIFLAIALVSIGFLTHKRNLDESVD